MSNESERSHHSLEVPDHDGTIEGSRHSLSQVWVEASGGDSVFVALEASLKCWVRYFAIDNSASVVANTSAEDLL